MEKKQGKRTGNWIKKGVALLLSAAMMVQAPMPYIYAAEGESVTEAVKTGDTGKTPETPATQPSETQKTSETAGVTEPGTTEAQTAEAKVTESPATEPPVSSEPVTEPVETTQTSENPEPVSQPQEPDSEPETEGETVPEEESQSETETEEHKAVDLTNNTTQLKLNLGGAWYQNKNGETIMLEELTGILDFSALEGEDVEKIGYSLYYRLNQDGQERTVGRNDWFTVALPEEFTQAELVDGKAVTCKEEGGRQQQVGKAELENGTLKVTFQKEVENKELNHIRGEIRLSFVLNTQALSQERNTRIQTLQEGNSYTLIFPAAPAQEETESESQIETEIETQGIRPVLMFMSEKPPVEVNITSQILGGDVKETAYVVGIEYKEEVEEEAKADAVTDANDVTIAPGTRWILSTPTGTLRINGDVVKKVEVTPYKMENRGYKLMTSAKETIFEDGSPSPQTFTWVYNRETESATKIWVDNNSVSRPGIDQVKFVIEYQAENETPWTELNQDNFTDLGYDSLPQVQSPGNSATHYDLEAGNLLSALNIGGTWRKVSYRIVEKEVPEGYVQEWKEDTKEIYNIKKISLSGTIEWRDASKPNYRPGAEEIKARIEGGDFLSRIVGNGSVQLYNVYDEINVTDNGDGTYSYTITGLPAFTTENQECTYMLTTQEKVSVREDALPLSNGDEDNYYAPTFDNGEGAHANEKNAAYEGGKIIMTLTGESTFRVMKTWLDDGEDTTVQSRPEATLYLWRYPKTDDTPADQAWKKAAQAVGKVQAGGAVPLTMEVDREADNKTYNFNELLAQGESLPQYDENGNTYIYFVKEIMEGSDYTSYFFDVDSMAIDYGVTYDNGFINNVRTEKKLQTVTKTWKANAHQSLLDQTQVEVELQRKSAGEGEEAWETVSLSEEKETHTFDSFSAEVRSLTYSYTVDEFDEMGKPYEYRWAEKSVSYNGQKLELTPDETDSNKKHFEMAGEQYTSEFDPQEGVITNRMDSEITYTVDKIWLDEDGNVAEAPEDAQIQIQIYQNDVPMADGIYTMTAENKWKGQKGQLCCNDFGFENNHWHLEISLPKFDQEGSTYEYRAIEISGYEGYLSTTEYERDKYYAKITNQPGPGEMERAVVQKRWLDGGDILHRQEVKVQLYDKVTGKPLTGKNATLNGTGNWAEELRWTREQAETNPSLLRGDNLIPGAEVYAKETAVGNSPVVYYDGAYYTIGEDGEKVYESITLDESARAILAAYNVTLSDQVGIVKTGSHYYIVGSSQADGRDEYIAAGVNYRRVSNRRVGILDIQVVKEWEDGGKVAGLDEVQRSELLTGTILSVVPSSEAGTKPEAVQVTGTKNNGNQEIYEFTDLIKYDAVGNLITYTLEETLGENLTGADYKENIVLNPYVTGAYHTDDTLTGTVINKRSALEEITFHKKWRDKYYYQTGKRPDIYVNLYYASEEDGFNEKNLYNQDGYKNHLWKPGAAETNPNPGVSEDIATDPYTWHCTMTDLERYDEKGYELKWYIQETINGGQGEYITSYYDEMYGTEDTAPLEETYAPENGWIENRLEGVMSLSGRKIWNLLPAGFPLEDLPIVGSITMELYQYPVLDISADGNTIYDENNGTKVAETIEFVQVGTDSEYRFFFKESREEKIFPRYDGDGQMYYYGVKEVYTGENAENLGLAFNSRTAGLYANNVYNTTLVGSADIYKEWDFGGKDESHRPEITYKIYRSNTGYGVDQEAPAPSNSQLWTALGENTKTLQTTDSANKVTFDNLLAIAPNGKYFYYYVEEVIEGIEQDAFAGTWQNGELYSRAFRFEIQKEDQDTAVVKLHSPLGGENSKADVNKNQYNPGEITEITGSKNWVDIFNSDGYRPQNKTDFEKIFDVKLYRRAENQPGTTNGYEETAVEGVEISWAIDEGKSSWEYSISMQGGENSLEKYAPNGMPWIYRVEETMKQGAESAYMVTGGTADVTITGNKGSAPASLVNSQKLTNVSVEKIWDDLDDIYQARPQSIYIQLQSKVEGSESQWSEAEISARKKEEGASFQENIPALVELKQENQWKHTWENLPAVNENGKTISYRVVEGLSEEGIFTPAYPSDNSETPGLIWENYSPSAVTTAGGSEPKTTQTTVFTNRQRRGTITLRKTESYTGDPIQEVTFKLTGEIKGSSQGMPIVIEGTTNAKGMISLNNVPLFQGTATLTEEKDGYTSASWSLATSPTELEGYQKTGDIWVKITKSGETGTGIELDNGSYPLTNDPISGSLSFVKGFSRADFGLNSFPDISFTLTMVKDDRTTIVSYPPDYFEEGKRNTRITFNAAPGTNGMVSFTGLPYGNYILKENNGIGSKTLLEGVDLSEGVFISKDKLNAGFNDSPADSFDVGVYTENDQLMFCKKAALEDKKLVNNIVEADFSFTKKNQDGTALSGAEFTLSRFDVAENGVYTATDYSQTTKEDSGWIDVTSSLCDNTVITTGEDGTFTISDLPYGFYHLSESSTGGTGVVDDSADMVSVYFAVKENNVIQHEGDCKPQGETGETKNFNWNGNIAENRIQYGYLKIKKTANEQSHSYGVLAGAQFDIYIGSRLYLTLVTNSQGEFDIDDKGFYTDKDGATKKHLFVGTEYKVKEVKVPSNIYKLAGGERTFTFTSHGQEIYLYNEDGQIALKEDQDQLVNNVIRQPLRLSKTDLNGTSLPGAVFYLIDKESADAAQVAAVIKEKNGEYSLLPSEDNLLNMAGYQSVTTKNIEGKQISYVYSSGESEPYEILYGDYIIREIQAPAGYQCGGDASVEVRETGINVTSSDNLTGNGITAGEVTAKNVKTSFTLRKVDEAGEDILAAEDQLELTVTGTGTDNQGGFTWTHTETGYSINKDQEVYPTLEINKDTGLISGLPVGTYTVTETKTPYGYQNFGSYQFAINSKGVLEEIAGNSNTERKEQTITITDPTILGSVGLVKYLGDQNNNMPLEGVKFNLYKRKENGQTLIQEELVTASETGEIRVENLTSGTYFFKEISATADSVLSTKEYELTIPGQLAAEAENPIALQTVNVENEEFNGAVIFKKTDGDDREEDKVLAGAVFKITEYIPQTPAGYAGANSYAGQSYTSDQDGNVKLEGLKKGTYTLVETTAQGYVTSGTWKFTIGDAHNGEEPQKLKDVLNSNNVTPVGAENIVENRRQSGSVVIGKADADQQSQSIDGAEFMLTVNGTDDARADKAVLESFTFKTGKAYEYVYDDGEFNYVIKESIPASNVSGHLTITGLPWGSYTLTETKPRDGYALKEGETLPSKNFAIEANSLSQNFATDGETLLNKLVGITIQKENLQGTLLPGAKFALTGKVVTSTGSTGMVTTQEYNDENPFEFEVNDRGEYELIGKLIVGQEYTITEVQAPEGYECHSPVTFTITDDGKAKRENVVDSDTVKVTDTPIEVTLTKTNERGEALKGAVFALYEEDVRIGWESQIALADNLETDQNGMLTIQSTGTWTLTQGNTYTLVETKAPSGYALAEPFTFTLDKDKADDGTGSGNITETIGDGVSHQGNALTVKDKKTSFTLKKVERDSIKGEEITGTKRELELAITDVDDTSKYVKWYHTAEGYIVESNISTVSCDSETGVITGLPAGSYKLEETITPEAYVTARPYLFIMKEDGTLGTADGNGTEVDARISDDGLILTMEDERIQGGVELTKTLGGIELPGAKFDLYKVVGVKDTDPLTEIDLPDSKMQEGLVTHEGKISLENLEAGQYYFKESGATADSLLNTSLTSDVFWIKAGEGEDKYEQPKNVAVEVSNEVFAAALTVNKKDFFNKENSVDAAFQLTYVPGEPAGNAQGWTRNCIAVNGVLQVTGLQKGSYTLTETGAAGYDPESFYSYTFKIEEKDAGKTVELTKATDFEVTKTGGEVNADLREEASNTIYNQRMSGEVEIMKLDETDETTAIDGAEFRLTVDTTDDDRAIQELLEQKVFVTGRTYQYSYDYKTLEGKITESTGATGGLTITGLPWGSYTLTETKPAEGYELSVPAPELKFTIKKDELRIPVETDGHSILNRKTEIEIFKADSVEKTKLLPGAEFVLTGTVKEKGERKEYTDVTPKELTVDQNGRIVLTGELIQGMTYTLKETKAPAGYQLSDTLLRFELDINGVIQVTSGVDTTWEIGQRSISKLNEKVSVGLSKVNSDNIPLEGGEFTIAGTFTDDDTEKTGLTVDNMNSLDGLWLVTTGTEEGKDQFTYTLTETKAPNGYELPGRSLDFTVDAKGSLVMKEDEVYTGNGTKTVTVKDTAVEITITKVDWETRLALDGAEFALTGVVAENGEKKTYTEQEPKMILVKDGTFTLTGELIIGEAYAIKETKAPDGYKKLLETISFTVNKDGTIDLGENPPEAVRVTESGDEISIANAMTEIVVEKVDELGTGLSGAVLEIKDQRGKEIERWITDGNPHVVRGRLNVGETYTLLEISAPAGYRVAVDTEFTVTDTGDNRLTMTDTKINTAEETGRITVTKVTTLSGEPVGLDYSYYTALFEDEGLTRRVTDIKELAMGGKYSSKVTFEHLTLGKTYYVAELDADGNLINSDEFLTVTINGHEQRLAGTRDTGSAVILNDYTDELPSAYNKLEASIRVEKDVEYKGDAVKVTDTFYVALFADPEYTMGIGEVRELRLNNSSRAEAVFEKLPAGIYYVMETDRNGIPVDSEDSSFKYVLTLTEESLELAEDGESQSTRLVNELKTYSRETEGKETEKTKETKKEERKNAAKTGDETDILFWMLLMAVAVAAALTAKKVKKPRI